MADNITNSNGNPGENFSNHPHFDGYEREGASLTTESGAGFMSNLGEIGASIGPAVTRYVDTYDRSLRANPYLHIGLAGAGALLLGYVLGRSTASPSTPKVRGLSEIDLEAAYDE
ncbi:MAG: hypothetical protein V4760_12760 [Bdellovibrionota bacterium]